jgi:glyoxylase-like metal-dependent hydrolase (beta-lactamase superfamily II)
MEHSMRSTTLAAVMMTATFGCAQPTLDQRILGDAVAALGGRERVLAVRTLVLEGEGTHFNLGQDMRPGARDQTFAVTAFTRRMDLTAERSRTELTRTPSFAYFQGPAAQRQVQGVDGAIGYNINTSGVATRVTTPVALERQADLYHHPLMLLRAALAPGATLSHARTEGAERVVEITTASGLGLVLAIDGTGLPLRIESDGVHPNLGNVALSTSYADYQAVGGLRLPARMTTRIDDFVTADVRFTDQRLDGDIGDLTAPAAAAEAAEIFGPPAPVVVAEQVAPGVWLLAGQSHHSAVVELSDGLMLVDAPQSEARTLAVIARARELRPDKPLTRLVMTHHHFDHTAGLRAAIAEGLTVVTHSGNRAFVEHMAQRSHAIAPDALAITPRPVTVQTVDDELIMTDAARTVALYHVAGNPHSDTMLMVHLPEERVLIQVDAFSPGAAFHPFAANLLENITTRHLRVDRIVALHGAIVPFEALEAVQASEPD